MTATPWPKAIGFFTDHCLRSTALTLSVPCSPMPMVSSVDQVAAYQVCSHPASVCLVDHVLHRKCPNVMTLGSQRRTVAYYSRGEMTSKVCLPSLGTSVPTVRTPDWSRPMGFYPSLPGNHTPKCATYVCMCLTSLAGVAPGDRALLTSDGRS